MKALGILHKDLQILLKDRGQMILLVLLPLAAILVFSGALTAMSGEETDSRIPLPVLDQDGGQAAQTLVADIEAAGGVRVEKQQGSDAFALLEQGDITRLLVIPAGFQVSVGGQQTLRLLASADADPEQTEALRLVIEGVARDMSLEAQIIASLEQMGAMQANAPKEYQVFSTERIVNQARSQFEQAQARPLISVTQQVPGQKEGEQFNVEDLNNIAVPSIAVLFLFLTAQSSARSIFDEKQAGSFRRLLAAPMSKASILVGKMLPNIVIGIAQAAVILLFGTVGLSLMGLAPMPLERDPLGVILVFFLVILCSSALGLLIAAIARTENQIGGLSSLVLWAMGMIGGSIIPVFFLEGFLGPLPKITPHYWANRAFDDLLVRGLGLSGASTEIAVLLGFAAVFIVVGIWQFDFE